MIFQSRITNNAKISHLASKTQVRCNHNFLTFFRYIAKNYAAANAEISQKLEPVMNQEEYGTQQNACADVLFLLFKCAQVNLFSTLRTAASKYNNTIASK